MDKIIQISTITKDGDGPFTIPHIVALTESGNIYYKSPFYATWTTVYERNKISNEN